MSKQIKLIPSYLTLSAFATLSWGSVSCQSGYDFENKCDPYYNVNLVYAKNIKRLEDRRLDNNSNSKNLKIDSSNYTLQKNLTYLDTLRRHYSRQFNGKEGLQALIDRSGYSTFKEHNKTKKVDLKEIKVVKDVNSTKTKNNLVTKNETKKIKKETKECLTKKTTKTTINPSTKLKKEKIVYYKVKEGDNLCKIAKAYSLNVSKLKKFNKIKKDGTIKIGQTLKIPVNSKASVKLAKNAKKVNKNFYIVKKSDTISSIAKKLNISIVKLREINRLSRSSVIKVGQKLRIKPRKTIGYKIAKYDIVKDTKFRKVPSLKFKRKIRVIATAYTSHRNQTDSTPFLAAWNNRLKPGMKIIAVSEDLIRKYGLKNGVKVKILGLPGYYVVRDKMNKRLRNHIDIYMGLNKKKALKWGRRRITLYW